MRIMVVGGSHRQKSESSRVAEYVAADLARIDSTLVVDSFSLSGNPLPLWDESVWQETGLLQPCGSQFVTACDRRMRLFLWRLSGLVWFRRA